MSVFRPKVDGRGRPIPRLTLRAVLAGIAVALGLAPGNAAPGHTASAGAAPDNTSAANTAPGSAGAESILFIGNSFTFGAFSPVREYRPQTVTDLNASGVGGVPALFKSFTAQAGLNYDVYLETEPGVGVEWHIDHRLGVIGRRPWDAVVIQGYVALDPRKPADAAAATAAVGLLGGFLRARNPAVELYLMATWSRADLTYATKSPWFGQPIDAMARDLRRGYDQAAKGTPGVKSVVPVGEAWTRAMHAGIATANPYVGAGGGAINLWAPDNFHASTYGYYLEALVLFGSITGRDPRSLGESECSAFELGLSPARIAALQQVAFDQLAAEGAAPAAPPNTVKTAAPAGCPQ